MYNNKKIQPIEGLLHSSNQAACGAQRAAWWEAHTISFTPVMRHHQELPPCRLMQCPSLLQHATLTLLHSDYQISD